VKTVDPTRLIIVSDIHSNHTALKQVLEDAGDFDAAICAGDIIGYGPEPRECINTLKLRDFKCVKGNHDQAAVTADTTRLNPRAAEALTINRGLLEPKHTSWLGRLRANLTFDHENAKIAVFHGSPQFPTDEYVYPAEAQRRAEELLGATGSDLLILGHTHIPFVHRLEGRALMNPGSVGQPRDGDPRASYMLVDITEGGFEVSHRRVEYGIDETASKMHELRLPASLADRLYVGR